ncbi:MAG TPA: hypothetical protein VHE55_05240 [Fimbriimonadaceae bacterium]|nr:hypothetical protein [Fimbriimonadaceae bacterium]
MTKKPPLPFPWLGALGEKSTFDAILADCASDANVILAHKDGSFTVLEGANVQQELSETDPTAATEYAAIKATLAKLGQNYYKAKTDLVVVFAKDTHIKRGARENALRSCIVHPRKSRGFEIVDSKVSEDELRYRLTL